MTQKQLIKLHLDQLESQKVIDQYTIESELSLIGSLLLATNDAVKKIQANLITQRNFVDSKNKMIFAGIYKHYITNKSQSCPNLMEMAKHLCLTFPQAFNEGYDQVKDKLLEAVTKSSLGHLDSVIVETGENHSKNLLANLKQVDFNKMGSLEAKAYLQNLVKEIDNTTVIAKPLSGMDAMDLYSSELEDRKNQVSLQLPFQVFQDAGVVLGSSNLVSVAGSPKAGKTSFALQTAIEFAKQEKNILFFTLELSVMEFIEKCLAYIAGLNPTVIKNIQTENNIKNHEQKWSTACSYLFGSLGDKIAFAGDKKFSIWEICQSIRESNTTNKLDFVYIDQLSFIHTNNMFGSEKHKEYDYIVRELKELCKELKICIVLLAQLNRGASGEDVDYADIQHIKDSSAVAETSDILIMAKRNEKHAKAGNELIEVKFTVVSRHSKGGVVSLDWDTKLAKFIG